MLLLDRFCPAALRVVLATALAAAAAVVAPSAVAATGHRCPSHTYWENVIVHGMTCSQAVRLHREKLRDCPHPVRRVTPGAYVYTCRFGPWKSIERVGRRDGFSDRIHISRNSGKVWMRYDALP